jgi:hypothetical protein
MAWALHLDALVPCRLWIGPKGRLPWSVQPVGSYGVQVLNKYARQTKKFVLCTWNYGLRKTKTGDNSLTAVKTLLNPIFIMIII